MSVDQLIAAARRILAPYTLQVHEVAWWSVYEIGQRLCERVRRPRRRGVGRDTPRVFIAGDACHTHSPKAGQGMNVSMGDAFNLGWKLPAVLRGQAAPALLDTYSHERHAVAKELIDFDREFAADVQRPPRTATATTASIPRSSSATSSRGRFTAGTATRYGPSVLVGAGTISTSPTASRSACVSTRRP